MLLLTQAQKNKLVENHKAQDGTKEFMAVVKLFNPTGVGTWYLSELDPESNVVGTAPYSRVRTWLLCKSRRVIRVQ